MRRASWIIGGGLLLGALALFFWWPDPEETRFYWASAEPPEVAKANEPVQPTRVAGLLEEAVGSPLAARLNAVDGSGQEDVQILHDLVVQYLQAMQRRQGPPIGDDMDLAKVLKWRNPLKRPVLDPSHPALSADGHLSDRWGTPYHVHALSSNAYRIRSAGPDRRLFTNDDLVAPSQQGSVD